ncbi:MAG TPA: acyltransferase family protein [Rhizomicrobium sp.]|jgi:peptidoglycan/LPS O-acetylase OafA/YrhL
MGRIGTWRERILRASPPAASGTRYRGDIDGLRAIAVLTVVFYHFGIPPFTGGFVGVDVFFVISGFLITSLIHAEMAQKRFSVAQFYERRIRRIFPALFLVLIAASVLSLVVLFPDDLRHFAQSLEATVVFGSNFLFRNTAGYWDIAARHKPLLHTWSLAVEEQYYVLFPAILYFAGKGGEWLQRATIAAIFIVSLALSIVIVHRDPTSAFYLLPYRAWELMLGGLIAVGGWAAPPNRIVREIFCAVGLALILYGVFAYSPETPFPGAAALAPCGGTALLIYAGQRETAVSSLLATAPMRGVGLISYSLYLWHWPMLVFARYALFGDLSALEKGGLIALSIALAALSWRFVELPFRKRTNYSRRSIFILAAVATAIGFAAGFAINAAHGLPQRYPARIQKMLKVEGNEAVPKAYRCLATPSHFDADTMECRFGNRAAKAPSFALWGDSYAEMYMPVLAKAAIGRGKAGFLASHHACPPMLGVASSKSRGCRRFNDHVLHEILADPNIKLVILTAAWAKSAIGTPYGAEDSGDVYLTDAAHPRRGSTAQDRIVFAAGFARLMQALAAKNVAIISSLPEPGWEVPQTLARIALMHSQMDMRPTLAQFVARQKPVLAVFADAKAHYGVRVVYPHLVLCASGHCDVEKDGAALYRDSEHLTYPATWLMAPLLDPLLNH